MRRALTGLDERAVFDTLLQRERLGSTGIGEGIAIPHGKPAGLAHLFGSRRGSTSRSISRLSTGSRSTSCSCCSRPRGRRRPSQGARPRRAALREPGMLDRIRKTRDADALYAVLSQTSAPRAA